MAEGVAAELGKYKTIALLSEQNDYNQAIKDVVEAELKNDSDTTIVANEMFEKGSTEFRNVLQKVKASGAEAVFLNPNIGTTTEALVKQLAEIQGWEVQKVSIFSMMAGDISQIAPEATDGTIIVDAPTINASDFLTYRDQIIAQKGSLDNLGNYYTASTLDALNILTSVIQSTKGDVEKARTQVATQSFTGRLGKYRFDNQTYVQGIGVARFKLEGGKAVAL